MPKVSRSILLEATPIFAQLSDAEFEQVYKATEVMRLSRRRRLFNEGEAIEYLYILVEGSIKTFKEDLNGVHSIKLARPKHFFSVRPYFTSQRHTCSAETCSSSIIYRIPTKLVEELISAHCFVSRYILEALLRQVDEEEQRHQRLMRMQMRARLADTLLHLRDIYGYEEDGYTLSIQLSRNDLADLSYMTPSNVSRTLSAFSSERFVSLERKKIKIINIDKLEYTAKIG